MIIFYLSGEYANCCPQALGRAVGIFFFCGWRTNQGMWTATYRAAQLIPVQLANATASAPDTGVIKTNSKIITASGDETDHSIPLHVATGERNNISDFDEGSSFTWVTDDDRTIASLARYRENGKVILFHGTNDDTLTPDMDHHLALGPGIYLTFNPNEAISYACLFSRKNARAFRGRRTRSKFFFALRRR